MCIKTQTQEQGKPNTLTITSSSGDPGSKILVFIATPGQTQTDDYWCHRTPSAWGVACHFSKIWSGKGRGDFATAEYDVLLDGERSMCDCQGFARWGRCRHLIAAAQLFTEGKLTLPPRPEHALERLSRQASQSLETCGFCGGNGNVYGSMYDDWGFQRYEEPPQLVCEYCGGTGRVENGGLLLPAAPRSAYER